MDFNATTVFALAKRGLNIRFVLKPTDIYSRLLVGLYTRLRRLSPQLLAGLLSFVLLATLQVSSPHFFFGDDNMQFTYVHMSEIARNLVHGENIFRHQYIFGGAFDMRRDPSFLSLWHPVSLLCSLVTLTKFKFWAVDLLVTVCLISASVAMARLFALLKALGDVRVSNPLVVLLSASYACSGYSIIVGEAWGNFAANVAALPMFLVGVLHHRSAQGVGWIAFAALLCLLLGHIELFCYSMVFVGLYAGAVALRLRSIRPICVLACGTLLAALLAFPLLWEAWCGFCTSRRAQGLAVAVSSSYSISIPRILAGYFLGWYGDTLVKPVQIFKLPTNGSFVLCTSFTSMLLVPALFRWRQRAWTSNLFLGLAAFAALLVARPLWLSEVLSYVPLFKSFKWPLRELLFFQFFVILGVAGLLGRIPLRRAAKFIALSVTVFAVSLYHLGRPSLNDFGDRELILSGTADAFWAQVRQHMPSDSILVPVGDPNIVVWRYKQALCLAGANNFPALYRVRSAGGYSFTRPFDTAHLRIPCDPFFGFFQPETIPPLLQTFQKLYIMEMISPTTVRVGLLESQSPAELIECRTISLTDLVGDRPKVPSP